MDRSPHANSTLHKVVSVASVISSSTKSNEKEEIESIFNSISKLSGTSEGVPFPLYCTGITKGQLIIEAGIYGTVKENIAEQICSTGMGESKDGIAACSDALVTVLIETASMIQAEVSSTIKSYVPNDASPDGNKSMHALIDAFTSKTDLSLKNFRIGWQQLPEGIVCICTCPTPKTGAKKEVLP